MVDENIKNQIVEDIKSLKSGEEFKPYTYFKKYGIENRDMFKYYDAILNEIKEIADRPKKYAEAIVGLPYNIPFVKK